MAWDRKARGGPRGYYYRSVRLPGRPGPVKIYLGRGAAAVEAAAEVSRRRAARAAGTAAVAPVAALGRRLVDLAERVRDVVAARLVAAGKHRHKGQWRQRARARGSQPPEGADMNSRKKKATPPAAPPPLPDPVRRQRLRDLTRAAERGSEFDRACLDQFLRDYPACLDEVGDLAARAEREWAGMTGMGDPAAVAATLREAARTRAELGGDRAAGEERLLIDLVVVCSLAERFAQFSLARTDVESPVYGMWLRRVELIGQRYLSALRLLAQVRALLPGEAVKSRNRRSAGPGTRCRPISDSGT